MAYKSNVSGRQEIYVEKYPEFGDRQQISADGGSRPIWSRNGRELFFSSLDWRQMLAVPIQSGSGLVAGRPQVLFEYPMLPPPGGARPYDLTPDGRFIIIGRGQQNTGGIRQDLVLVQNWFQELQRLVPTREELTRSPRQRPRYRQNRSSRSVMKSVSSVDGADLRLSTGPAEAGHYVLRPDRC